MSFEWDESFVDEVRNFTIRVGLGFQPSTCASSRRGREIDQERFAVSFRLLERCVRVFNPIDEHIPSIPRLRPAGCRGAERLSRCASFRSNNDLARGVLICGSVSL